MAFLSEDDRKTLLKLSRSAIEAELVPGSKVIRPSKASPALREKRGCFVTLNLNEALRGCIGVIEPDRGLVDEVETHARLSAFDDPRFSPLTRDELQRIRIEVSVLTIPEPLHFNDPETLLDLLVPGKHGVILSQGDFHATFLPQVWEQLPAKRSFLTHLCRKAGLSRDCWKSAKTRIRTYEAEYFSEPD